MPVTFVHLSDIHFGQEKGGQVVIHDDVKECLIKDAAALVKSRAGGCATGVIVTGDVAYAGKREEYQRAADWLDLLTDAIGCAKTAVQVVPGNHDIDREAISSGCKLMLAEIIANGEAKLDAFLEDELDREVLYGRFAAYRPFAEGYNCPLDRSGGIASDRSLELAPGRTLRFIGLNSALICSTKDQEGRLLLGARQRVLPRTAGEELVVLCHHPLHWLQDSEEARRYIRSRARVFVSGHEHNPSLQVENIKEKHDLMTLEAGATVPPKADNEFNYTYNLLIFDWDADAEGLKVTVIPRAWSPEDTDFDCDGELGGPEQTIVLACPNFRRGTSQDQVQVTAAREAKEEVSLTEGALENEDKGGESLPDMFPLLLLRFFRDLSPRDRIAALVKLKALPDEWRDPLTHAVERRVVYALANAGRLAELDVAINEIQAQDGQTPGGSQD